MNTKQHSNQPPPACSTRVPRPLYQLSTQFRNWRFSQSGLEQARTELNQVAVGRVRTKLEEERNVELPSTGEGPAEPSQVEYLTVQDELELVTFYLSKISQLSRAAIFHFPETVEATAMSYLKRFYLRNTCMDYHPKNIMLTCLFLATKTENTSISIDSFASRIPKTTNADVLALEFLVAQSLKFQFKVHHAHLAARGMYLDLQQQQQEEQQTTERLDLAWAHVQALLRAARLTDLEFLWTPSQIACAAWWTADRELTEPWLHNKAGRLGTTPTPTTTTTTAITSTTTPTAHRDPISNLGVGPLLEHIREISGQMLQAKERPIDKERVTTVDRRLRFCRNPEKDPSSALFKIKQAELDQASLDKHQLKFPHPTPASNQDPFA
ncbi:hypothetical protein PCANC_06503 [Puccinia coronata f. sp. avenae]|uniref:Cyclin-like domain-containing protein n=1 Tax=Puccinia coronata f. sp. avenae TaxID=200324 RepID=A0A2N5VAG5_9BASI|nr:hypothetical protein PCASD_13439 [Puccinia coronata f. sp. avenae]PLW46999.1 hypothetical protein PCANC_06503 [Puccinia coronata f. sp. avenae]